MSAFRDRIRDQKNKGLYKVADLEGGKEVTHVISHLLEEVEMFGKTVDILNFTDTARQLQLNTSSIERPVTTATEGELTSHLRRAPP